MLACAKGFVKVVNALMQKGADIRRVDKVHNNTADGQSSQDPWAQKKLDKLKDNSCWLVSINYSPFLQNGSDALMMAAKNGHLDVVKVLWEQADVNIVDKVLSICG